MQFEEDKDTSAAEEPEFTGTLDIDDEDLFADDVLPDDLVDDTLPKDDDDDDIPLSDTM